MSELDQLVFRHPWRPYQSRVLQAIDQHLDDKRLHVVAAPGAGKTTLGLEVVRKLGKRALVLSPTRVIRDQWVERLSDFLDGQDPSGLDWVSRSMDTPGTLTSITYQALHARFAGELQVATGPIGEVDKELADAEVNGFIEALIRHDIEVLVLDEAHHLRAAWWRALDRVCQHLPHLVLVSLTATPPYDSTGHEWLRYEQLCGPIDEEISVPELVRAGTLCPHQDFIWASAATRSESEQVEAYDDRVYALCGSLRDDPTFAAIVLAHPWLMEKTLVPYQIDSPELAIAILSFLIDRSSHAGDHLLALLELSVDDIPALDRRQWQYLLQPILYAEYVRASEHFQDFVENLRKQLRASQLLEKRQLRLLRSRRVERSLSLSRSKIQACVDIHELESSKRGSTLRQVILVDYIRDEYRQSPIDTGLPQLGAWPIFKALIAGSRAPERAALITGRISVIHRDLVPGLMAAAGTDRVAFSTMAIDERFVEVTGPLNRLTVAYTQMLSEGEIHVLVGTRALLGEGWDAPCVNSLVLASAVGSFMLTNQMRGRAIRVDRSEPHKVSSIWHLVAINQNSWTGLRDLDSLEQRFDRFVGLSESEASIESGFRRLAATGLADPESPVARNNQQMRDRFGQIQGLADRWQDAIVTDGTARIVPSVRTRNGPSALRGYVLKNSLRYLVLQLTGLIVAVLAEMNPLEFESIEQLLLFVGVVIVAVLFIQLPTTLKVIRIAWRHLPVGGSLRQIGRAVAQALCQTEAIQTSIDELKVTVSESSDGQLYLAISGCSFHESSLFADCVSEILAPIQNPRYLVSRKGSFGGLKRVDFHAVPTILGAKKQSAEIFHEAWCRHVSPSVLIFTRTVAGRKKMLLARARAFSSNFVDDAKRVDRWQ